MVIKRVGRWFDDRLGASHFARTALNKVFPDNWSFMLGEIALYAFITLVLTGIYLAFFFVPSAKEVVYHGKYAPLRGVSMSEAYQSAVRLSFDVRAGLVMRQIHHWAALLFLAAIVTHLCRIFFTGAFRRPRELNWIVGVTLLLLAGGTDIWADLFNVSIPSVVWTFRVLVIVLPILTGWFTWKVCHDLERARHAEEFEERAEAPIGPTDAPPREPVDTGAPRE